MATIRDAIELITRSRGKVMTVQFIKRDGTLRIMNCRLGVSKGVTGAGMSFDPYERGLIPVYDMTKRAYRMINAPEIREVRALGEVLRVG